MKKVIVDVLLKETTKDFSSVIVLCSMYPLYTSSAEAYSPFCLYCLYYTHSVIRVRTYTPYFYILYLYTCIHTVVIVRSLVGNELYFGIILDIEWVFDENEHLVSLDEGFVADGARFTTLTLGGCLETFIQSKFFLRFR